MRSIWRKTKKCTMYNVLCTKYLVHNTLYLIHCTSSHHSFVGKAVIAVLCNDDMIKDSDLHQFSGGCKFFGEVNILLARFHISAGVVMTEDDTHSFCFKCFFEDHFGIDYRS